MPDTVTRRSMLQLSMGLLTAIGHAPSALSRTFDAPPVFETARSQFTMIEPARKLSPVRLRKADGAVGVLEPRSDAVTLISIWATWCANCREDLRSLAALHRRSGKTVRILTISTDELDREIVAQFMRELGVDDLPTFLDPLGEVAGPAPIHGNLSSALGMPITYLVQPDATIAGYITGSADWTSEAAILLLRYYQ